MDFSKSIIKKSWVEIAAIVISVIFAGLSLLFNNHAVALFPVVFLGAAFLSLNIKSFYFLFALVLPFSVEIELTGGLATDLPSEPIMWVITGLGLFFFLIRAKTINFSFWKHPISMLLFLHIMWIGATGILSSDHLYSIKYFIAKLWYVIPFYFLFGLIYESRNFVRMFFKILILSTSIAILGIMVRHGMEGFSFKSINDCVYPIFRNHVNYAVMLVALFPYLFWLRSSSKSKSFYSGLVALFLIAIFFSYTRAAMIALLFGLGIYLVVRMKKITPAIVVFMLIISISIPFLLHNNRYMDYTPNYERTIAHYNFDNLIEATYKLEDISTMERLYRWIAGIEMVKEKPIFGFGPATFYSNYQKFTLPAFETYVSNNPEKSGIHNYYLMILVEQGVIGLLIWIILIVVVFVVGQKVFHLVKKEEEKSLIMAVLCSICMVAAILIINDLMEVDKIGPIVFVGMAVIAASNSAYTGIKRKS